MGSLKGPPEAENGGKRGHSNTESRVTHQEAKAGSRRRRSREGRAEVQQALRDHAEAMALGTAEPCAGREEAFRLALDHVLKKNAELYRRLA